MSAENVSNPPPRPVVEFWHDYACPWSYCLRVRLEKLRPELAGRLHLEFRSFPLELLNRQSTRKDLLESEWPLCALQEPSAPFRNWSAKEWEFPATLLPAFEAAKCAELQGEEAAARYDLALREALFGESRAICMRHELLSLAAETELDVARFRRDFDSGSQKARIFEEYAQGSQRGVKGTPTLVLPGGRMLANFTLTVPRFTPDHKVARVVPPAYAPEQALQALREALGEAQGEAPEAPGKS